MQTPKEWLESVKNDPEKMNKWLSSQWYAEIEAAMRIEDLAYKADTLAERKLLFRISEDESKHAKLLKELCEARNINLPTKGSGRYYDLICIDDLSNDELYALGHHAEAMLLSRIEAICEDEEVPEDIREKFLVLLKDEQMHEKAFGALATEESLVKMKDKHNLGVAALGLTL